MEDNGIEKRVEKLELDVSELFKRTNDSKEWQAKYGEKIENIESLVKSMAAKPQQRWDTLIAAIISAVVAIAVSLFASGGI